MIPSGIPSAGTDFKALSKTYGEFRHPEARIELGGKQFAVKTMVISDISVELTAGFEASAASFRIYNAFNMESGKFLYGELKKQVLLGNDMTVSLGYLGKLTPVFTGFVAGVTFGFDPSDLPYIEVTGMDIKGVMMANSYAYQLSAKAYSDAVREVLQKTVYENLQNANAVAKIAVEDTPDKKQGGGNEETAETIEMVSESDYEFVVKAAKKFNFEFFTDCGTVHFRKAKSNTGKLMEIGIGKGIVHFEIGYSLTGMVEQVEACSMDAGSGKVIFAKAKYDGKLSTGSKAKKLIKGSRHVYIDPSIVTPEHAAARAASLLEAMEYRLGSLRCECFGIPELKPGRFIGVEGLGSPADNTFYLTNVTHTFSNESGYRTKLQGCARTIQ
ncbi:MAG: hypothetical protein FWG31_04620 [Oscillospiraceae bacterium]|nr:hypothetical protein [Oscillospiraceae bacterium]